MCCSTTAPKVRPPLGGTRCRHCSETETLAHVLGSCPHGELLRNSRHHRIRSRIASSLAEKNWEVHEEIHCVAENGSTRRIDIIAIDKVKRIGYIIDPTVRFETSIDQPSQIDQEKKNIYEPTANFFKSTYNLKCIAVIGLLVGCRGTIPQSFQQFCTKFNMGNVLCKDVDL